jgi:hypothetical protein
VQDRIKGPPGRCLGNVTRKVVPDPAFIPTSLRELLQRMPGKSKPLEQSLEFVRSGFALGGPRLTSRHLPSSTVCSRFTHQIETAQSFAKHGVTDIAASIQDDGARPFISGIRFQWQFKDEAGGVLARHSSRNYEGVHTSSRGVWEIALPGDALPTPGMNAGARRAFRSRRDAAVKISQRRGTAMASARNEGVAPHRSAVLPDTPSMANAEKLRVAVAKMLNNRKRRTT